MIRRFMAWSLALLLITSAEARERTLEEQARKIKPGSMVVVTLQDNTTLKGRLRQVSQDRLTIEQPGQVWLSCELLFQDVRKVAVVKEYSTGKKVERVLEEVFMIPAAVIFYTVYALYCGVFRRTCDFP